MPPLLIGMHDLEGAVWMKDNGMKGICLMLETVQREAKLLDYTAFANAGITVLLRISFGDASNRTGTIPPPKGLEAFENAVV